MSPRNRIFLLVAIMTCIVVVVEAITITILYHTALAEEQARLIEAAKSQARLIEEVARFNQTYGQAYPFTASEATIRQIKAAHALYDGFGETGEFTLSTKKNDQIIFLLSHRHYDLNNPKPVPWDSHLAAPMRLALSGKSGTVVDFDYRGVKVLAAHEPVAVLNLGIVAKIDLAEVRAPFIKAGLISGLCAMVIIGLGVSVFFRLTNPLIETLNQTVTKLQQALAEVKTLQGILPICSFCKKIRDDAGYWNRVEVYIKQRSNADFSHGICPDCLKQHYPDMCDDILQKMAEHQEKKTQP